MLDLGHLPKVNPDVIEITNVASRIRFGRIPANDGLFSSLSISATGTKFEDSSENLYTCQIYTGLGHLAITAKKRLVDLMCDQILPGWRDENPSRLHLSWRYIVCIEETLKIFGFESFEFTAAEFYQPVENIVSSNSVTLDIEIDNEHAQALITFATLDEDKITAQFGAIPQKAVSVSLIGVPMSGAIIGSPLTYGELAELEKGDALLLKQTKNGLLACEMMLAPHLTYDASCTVDGKLKIDPKGAKNE